MPFRKTLMFVALTFVAIAATYWTMQYTADAQTISRRIFESPLPTPVAPLSDTAQIALRYVADRYQFSASDLLVVNEHTRTYPLTSRSFQAVTIRIADRPDSPEFKLLVDQATGRAEEDIDAVEDAERAAY